MLRAVVIGATAISPEYESDSTRLGRDYAFCIVVGGGQVGTMIANQLLDLGWPAQLIEVAVSDDTPHHIKQLKNKGIKCTLSESIYDEKIGRATVIILAIRPSNLEQFTRAAGKHMPQNALLVSCLSGVPAKKIKASLNSNHVIRTMVSSGQLPLNRNADDSPQQAIATSLFHAIANAEDANTSLDVLIDLLRKQRIGENIIPKRVATAPDFMQFVKKVIKDQEKMFCHLLQYV